MRKMLFIIILQLFCSSMLTAQRSVNDFLGTWQAERNDTVFTIKLLESESVYNGSIILVYGGYSIFVKGVGLTDDYLHCNIDKTVSIARNVIRKNVFIFGSYSMNKSNILFTFFDQRKKHCNGDGISAGNIDYIASNKIHWTLNEKRGLWWKYEGDENADENVFKEIGFSVPVDIVLERVK